MSTHSNKQTDDRFIEYRQLCAIAGSLDVFKQEITPETQQAVDHLVNKLVGHIWDAVLSQDSGSVDSIIDDKDVYNLRKPFTSLEEDSFSFPTGLTYLNLRAVVSMAFGLTARQATWASLNMDYMQDSKADSPLARFVSPVLDALNQRIVYTTKALTDDEITQRLENEGVIPADPKTYFGDKNFPPERTPAGSVGHYSLK